MADNDQLKMIREDVDLWNAWRVQHADDKIDLSNANLERCDLILADLAGADLSGASLVMANLKAADLRGANLSGANLVGARMIGVDLVAANISAADLRTAEDLTSAQLEETQGDRETQLPDNVEAPLTGSSRRLPSRAERDEIGRDHSQRRGRRRSAQTQVDPCESTLGGRERRQLPGTRPRNSKLRSPSKARIARRNSQYEGGRIVA